MKVEILLIIMVVNSFQRGGLTSCLYFAQITQHFMKDLNKGNSTLMLTFLFKFFFFNFELGKYLLQVQVFHHVSKHSEES